MLCRDEFFAMAAEFFSSSGKLATLSTETETESVVSVVHHQPPSGLSTVNYSRLKVNFKSTYSIARDKTLQSKLSANSKQNSKIIKGVNLEPKGSIN
jgi:hypothetical protein